MLLVYTLYNHFSCRVSKHWYVRDHRYWTWYLLTFTVKKMDQLVIIWHWYLWCIA